MPRSKSDWSSSVSFSRVALYVGYTLVAEGRPGIVHPAEVVGLVRREQSLQEVDDAPGSRGVLAARRGQRARDQREERAVDQRVPVDEKQRGMRRAGLAGAAASVKGLVAAGSRVIGS